MKLHEYLSEEGEVVAPPKVRKPRLKIQDIANDLKEFKSKIGGDSIDVAEKSVTLDARDIGNWEHDEDGAYEHEDPESDSYDPGWREDDDNMVWSRQSYERYHKMFADWIATKSWAKKVNFKVYTSEKSWAYFEIELKTKEGK